MAKKGGARIARKPAHRNARAGSKRTKRTKQKTAAPRTKRAAPPTIPHPKGQPVPEITAANQAAFIEAFRTRGTILCACAVAQVGRTTVREWRADPEFEARFADAREDAADMLEAEARRRAHDGWDEPVFGAVGEVVDLGNGKTRTLSSTRIVGGIRKYSDPLMRQLLEGNRPEKFNRQRLEHTGKDGAPLNLLDLSKFSDEQLATLAVLIGSLGGAPK